MPKIEQIIVWRLVCSSNPFRASINISKSAFDARFMLRVYSLCPGVSATQLRLSVEK